MHTHSLTFALDRRHVLDTLAAGSLGLALRLRINDDSVRGAGGADDSATLPAVMLAIEGREFESADHTLFALGVWNPYGTRSHRLVTSW